MDTSLRGSLSDTVVLRVRAPYPDFWRGQTFTQFDGRTWHVDTATRSHQVRVTKKGDALLRAFTSSRLLSSATGRNLLAAFATLSPAMTRAAHACVRAQFPAPLRAQDGVPDWTQVQALLREWNPQRLLVGLPPALRAMRLSIVDGLSGR